MIDEEVACCNCSCPINYDCQRFKLFFDGKYTFSQEFKHNDNYSCDHKPDENNHEIVRHQGGLF